MMSKRPENWNLGFGVKFCIHRCSEKPAAQIAARAWRGYKAALSKRPAGGAKARAPPVRIGINSPSIQLAHGSQSESQAKSKRKNIKFVKKFRATHSPPTCTAKCVLGLICFEIHERSFRRRSLRQHRNQFTRDVLVPHEDF